MWVSYVSQMEGRPELRTKAAQMVLHYLMSQPSKVVQAWRQRVYYYSSATIFDAVCPRLKQWVEEGDGDRLRLFRKVFNREGLFPILGDAIASFIKMKSAPFPNALHSKESYDLVEAWQRAMIFIHMFRHVAKIPANKHWYNYGYEHYHTNVVLFRRYLRKDRAVTEQSPIYKKLPKNSSPSKRKRTPASDTTESVVSPVKTMIEIQSSSDDE